MADCSEDGSSATLVSASSSNWRTVGSSPCATRGSTAASVVVRNSTTALARADSRSARRHSAMVIAPAITSPMTKSAMAARATPFRLMNLEE